MLIKSATTRHIAASMQPDVASRRKVKEACPRCIYEIGATWPNSYDRVVIGKNGPYVLACFRAEGEDASWWYMPHDEYLLLVEGEVRVDYIEPRDQLKPGPHKTVTGTDMGHMVLRDGSLASLPARVAYRMRAAKKSLVLLQTKHSEWLTYAWEDICLTEA